MSNYGGYHSQFEKDLRTRLKLLSDKMIKLENKLQKVMVESMNNPKKSTAYWNVIRRDIDKIYKEMNIVFAEWSKIQIPLRYRNSLRSIQARIEVTKSILNTAKKGIIKVLNSNASSQIMQSLYRSAIDSFAQASILGKKNMYNLTRITQQTLINESLIDVTVAASFDLGDIRIAARVIRGQLWDELWKQVEYKQFVQAGRYHYKPKYYAEMVARSKFHEAQSLAARAQAANYGTDLIQVSSHNTTTIICQDYEGKIFSISGNDKRFPRLMANTPYHPNCLHLEFPTFESAMIVQGTLDSFAAFSRNEISKPPVPSGFIPIIDRKIA